MSLQATHRCDQAHPYQRNLKGGLKTIRLCKLQSKIESIKQLSPVCSFFDLSAGDCAECVIVLLPRLRTSRNTRQLGQREV